MQVVLTLAVDSRGNLKHPGDIEVKPYDVIIWKIEGDFIKVFRIVPKKKYSFRPFTDAVSGYFDSYIEHTVADCKSKTEWEYSIEWTDSEGPDGQRFPYSLDPKITVKPDASIIPYLASLLVLIPIIGWFWKKSMSKRK